MVATRSRKPKEEDTAPEAAAGSGIKAPARRGRAKKADQEMQEEEKAKTTSKKAAPKSRGKAGAKKEPEPELESEAQEVEEEPTKVEAKKPAPRGRVKAASKPEPESEMKITTRSTRAAAPPAVAETSTKTRKASQTKAKPDTATKKRVNKTESEEKPKTRGRKGSVSKNKAKAGNEKQLPPVIETTAEGEEAIEGDKQVQQAASVVHQATLADSTSQSPDMPQSSKIPLPSAPSQLGSPPKVSTTATSFRSSVLSSPEKSLGSPRKPPVPPKILNSPPKSWTGSPFRLSHIEAPSVRRFNIQSPFKPPMLRPVASESQLSLSARKQALLAPGIAPRPSTSSGPSTTTSPTKSSMRVAGALSPKKSVTFNHHTPEKIEAPAPATPKAAISQAQSVAYTALQSQQPLQAIHPTTPKPQIFTNLTFYVDVRDHRTGANASMLFTPLLVDLGATVIPSWSSNTDAVTHVLFKDGDLMTLEKVVASAGTVKAVNIGYPLDCEREGRMLDERGYLIDLPSVPGLQTPGKHSSAVGTPRSVKTKSAAATPAREVMAEIEFPTIAGLRIKTPSFAASMGAAAATTPFVPGASVGVVEEDKENVSPMPTNALTPLQQKSCPAKQEYKPLFAVNVSGKEEMTPLKKKWFGTKRRETMMPKFG